MTAFWLEQKRKAPGLMSVALLASTACSVTADFGAPSSGGGGGSSTRRDDVTVTFRNMTESEAVDVEFYTTEDELDNLPADLFDPENDYLVIRNIGLGGRGWLGPDVTDIIHLPCVEGLTLGTAGGTFVDDDSGEERGRGTQRWARVPDQFSCGATIIFEFTRSGNTFSTDLDFGPDGG